jgi:hypothetical protein
MGYVLELLPKTIINNGDTNLLTEGSVNTFKNAVNQNIPLERQINDLAKDIGDTEGRISSLTKDKANWEFIKKDISDPIEKWRKGKLCCDGLYPVIEKYGTLRNEISDFSPMGKVGQKPSDWFFFPPGHLAELGRVQQRFTFADSKIVAIDSQINSLKNELPYKRESLKKLQEQYAEISKQKISEIKAKTDIEIAKQKSETERLAQQQAPILAAQQSRTKILTYFVIGGVVLILGGAFLLRNK